MPRRTVTVPLMAILATACTHAPGSFRLIQATPGAVLIPPGVKDASVARASVPVPLNAGKPKCPPSPSGFRIAGKSLIVTRAALMSTTPAELSAWTTSLEKTGCIASGESFALTASLLDALPLEVAKRRTLLSTAQGINLTSVNSLRVVSPIFRPGAPADSVAVAGETNAVEQGASSNSVVVGLKANPDLTGYEIAWYDVLPRTDGPGFRIAPRNAEAHIGGQVEKETAPGVNRFATASDARWFRYFLMTRASSDRNDYNIVVLGAPTHGELELRTEAFAKDASGYLRTADKSSFAAMTPQFGVNPYLRVKVQGVDQDLDLGVSVRQAIEQTAGRGSAQGTLAHLTVLQPHNGKLARVDWDRTGSEILNLPLEGGEEITW